MCQNTMPVTDKIMPANNVNSVMSYLQRDLNYLWGQGHLVLLQQETDSLSHIQHTFSIVSTISGQ